MNCCILFAGVEDEGQVWPDKHSLPLQRMAGSNVLGHVLGQLWDAQPDQVVVVVERDGAAITAWFEEEIPHIEVEVITVPPGSKPLAALAACREYGNKDPLLVALGSHVTEADYKDLQQRTAAVTLFTKPQQDNAWAGACYFRRGADCFDSLENTLQAGSADFAAFLDDLRQSGLPLEKQPATMCLETRTAEDLLFTNARLLGLGYGTEDAIERSYMEDFTVLPPVFLHETAVIENAVVGPFVNVEAGAIIRGSVVRNSLIGWESTIEDVVLDGSLIGARACVKASGQTLFVEDDEEITLAAEWQPA